MMNVKTIFDYDIDDIENFYIDEYTSSEEWQTTIFHTLEELIDFLVDKGITLEDIESDDSGGWAWQDVQEAYNKRVTKELPEEKG